MRVPIMYIRNRKCNETNGLKPNCIDGETLVTVVVMWPDHCSEKMYGSAWQRTPSLSPKNNDYGDYTTIPDVDIVKPENIFVFESDNVLDNYNAGLAKMQELWAQVSPIQ